MSLDDFLQTVFLFPDRGNSFENLTQILQKNISALYPNNDQNQQITGRLGPMAVSMNKSSVAGSLQYTEQDLEIESHSNFSSIRANVCVHKGKWMYEVTLGTAGIQQLGWAPIDCPFTNEEGVGDSPDSYAYDGKRIKKWNVSCANYGQAWTTGDVIGSCLDLDQGTLSFYRNGVSLGVAFNNVRAGENGPGLAYFPAVSLSYGERCLMNFGSRPFKYPVQDYLPLHISNLNSRHLNEKISLYLLDSFVRLVSIQLHDPYVPLLSNTTTATTTTTTTTTSSNNSMEIEFSNSGIINNKSSLNEEDVTIIGSYIFDILGPMFQDEYLVCKVLVPYLEHFISSQKTLYLNKLMNAIFIFLEQHELKVCVDTIFSYLGYLCRTQSYTTLLEITSSSHRFLPLKLVNALLSIPTVLESFLKLSSHSLYLEHYFTVKQPNVVDLSVLVPVVWWQNTEEDICSKEKLEESCQTLSEIYTLHDNLLLQLSMVFLNRNSDNFNNDNFIISPSQSFRLWLRNVIRKNKGTTRNILPAGLSDSTVLSSLYFILLKILNNYFTTNISDTVKNFPYHVFYDDTLDYYDFSRIGGTVSHLVKNMPIIDQTSSKDGISLYDELFDDLVLIYHLCMSSKFKQAALNHQNQVQTITQLEDTTKRIARARELNSEGVEHLILAKKVFRDDVVDHIRLCTWHKVVLFQTHKQDLMWNSVNFLVKLFSHLTNLNPLFSYVPEFYIESLIDTFHALRRGDPPFNLTDPKRLTELIDIIQFLIFHFDDKRIINPDLRDLLLQSISVLLQYQDFVKIFELPQVNGYHLIRQLLASFDTRFWSPISTILLRFWRGYGFGQPAKKVNDCSSEIYQKYFRDLCGKENEVVDSYLNKIFNNLNWALTEFGVAAKEFQTALSRHFTEVQQFQRKCTVMFDFSFNLLRMLEFVAYESPATFLDSEMNLTRLTESLLFVLNRTTSGPDAKIFENLLKLDMAALDRINRAAILGPVAGIVLNLAASNGKFSLSTYFLSTGGFNVETLKFLTKFEWKKSITEENVILDEKLNKLQLFIKHVEKEAEELAATQSDKSEMSHSASVDFCSICCAAPIDTYFVPCKHRSCNKCIKRHMLNSNKCFFCNAEIASTVLEDSA